LEVTLGVGYVRHALRELVSLTDEGEHIDQGCLDDAFRHCVDEAAAFIELVEDLFVRLISV
jgi:hypothetical protein